MVSTIIGAVVSMLASKGVSEITDKVASKGNQQNQDSGLIGGLLANAKDIVGGIIG